MFELLPSLLVESEQEFERRLRLVEQGVKTIHVDILDGTLFPHTNWHDAEAVGAMNTTVNFELHLMVRNPLPIVEEWKKFVPTTSRAIIHAELARPLATLVEHIHDIHHLEAGIALNPETPIEEIHHLLPMLETVLLMSIHPGQSGQPFLGESILKKISDLHLSHPRLPISVDGGIKKENILSIAGAGASRFCLASTIFESPNPIHKLQELSSLLERRGGNML